MPENFPRLFGFGDGREDRLISVFPLKKSLSEVLRHSVDIAEGDVDKLAPFIETALGGGGGSYLTTEEKLQVFRSVKQLTPKRVALCAACIPASTGQVVNQIRAWAATHRRISTWSRGI